MKAYGVPVETIVNGIELPSTLAHAMALHTPRQLIFAGRFVSQKNLLLAVEALAQLRDLNWRATFIGDGPLMSEIRSSIQARGLAERIALPGWQDSASVDRAMAESDLFLIPSTAEGLPMAAVQALRHGLAIVGTDIGGLHDVIVDERNGFRVPVGDVDALAARLRALLEDDAMLLKMKAASWEHARLFDLDAITTQYENVLCRAAKRRSSKPTDHAD
jgi:glycosyltransferase involved in cell wall biosynthesis